MSTLINSSICPVCGQSNQCAIEIAESTGNPLEECWCASVVFTAETLAKVPAQALNKACICKKCASEGLWPRVVTGSRWKRCHRLSKLVCIPKP